MHIIACILVGVGFALYFMGKNKTGKAHSESCGNAQSTERSVSMNPNWTVVVVFVISTVVIALMLLLMFLAMLYINPFAVALASGVGLSLACWKSIIKKK